MSSLVIRPAKREAEGGKLLRWEGREVGVTLIDQIQTVFRVEHLGCRPDGDVYVIRGKTRVWGEREITSCEDGSHTFLPTDFSHEKRDEIRGLCTSRIQLPGAASGRLIHPPILGSNKKGNKDTLSGLRKKTEGPALQKFRSASPNAQEA